MPDAISPTVVIDRDTPITVKLLPSGQIVVTFGQNSECDPDAVMTMGMYFDVQKALQALKQERVRCGLSIGDVAARSGLDRAVISRLENGKQDNPTIATLMRYAAAVGKRFLWSYEDLATKVTNGHGAPGRRRSKRSVSNP